jgi:hypothetical protein
MKLYLCLIPLLYIKHTYFFHKYPHLSILFIFISYKNKKHSCNLLIFTTSPQKLCYIIEVNQITDGTEILSSDGATKKIEDINGIEEDEGIDEFDDEEKALVENEPANDDDTTVETTTNTNTTTENTTTTVINDSDSVNQWKEER